MSKIKADSILYITFFFNSLVLGWIINTVNIQQIRTNRQVNNITSGFSLVHNQTINSIDNYWYINHIKNYLKTGEFTYDTTSRLNAVRRTPLYPMFYGLHYVVFGEAGSFKAIKITQMLLYACSAVLLYIATFRFTGNKKVALLTYLIYATFLPFITYLSYTITEAVSPALNCIFLYFLSRTKQNNTIKNWLCSGIMFSILVLTRPNSIFVIFSVLFLLIYYSKQSLKKILYNGLAFVLGSILFFLPWMIHNYKKTNGDIILLEKYYGDQMDYGMPNMHLKYWIASWMNPGDYSSEIISNACIHTIIYQPETDKYKFTDSLLQKTPSAAWKGNKRQDVRDAYLSLYDYYYSKINHVHKDTLAQLEAKSIENFNQLKTEFIKQAPFYHYVLVPLQYTKSLIFQSNSSTLAFLHNYESNPLLYFLKLYLYIFNIICYISLPLLLILYKKYKDIFWITLLYVSSTFFIIMYVNKNFEVRYTYTYFPMLFMCVAIVITEISNSLFVRLNRLKQH